MVSVHEHAVADRLSTAAFPSSGVHTPEGAKVVAQGEEKTAEAEKERDAPNGIDPHQIHEEELAHDEQERIHRVPDEPGYYNRRPAMRSMAA